MLCNLPRRFLGAIKSHRYDEDTVIQIPITQIELENGVSAGVQFIVMVPGIVPPHEEHEARLERGIRIAEWMQMDVYEKALVIANRRVRIAQSNLQADAEIKNAKKKGGGAGRKR